MVAIDAKLCGRWGKSGRCYGCGARMERSAEQDAIAHLAEAITEWLGTSVQAAEDILLQQKLRGIVESFAIEPHRVDSPNRSEADDG